MNQIVIRNAVKNVSKNWFSARQGTTFCIWTALLAICDEFMKLAIFDGDIFG